MDATTSKIAKKRTGSFYSPSNLAYYVASKICDFIPSEASKLRVLDPAVGDGILLIGMSQSLKNKSDNLCHTALYYGIDINSMALKKTSNMLRMHNLNGHLVKSDFIKWADSYLIQEQSIKEHIESSQQTTIIISNPPWGAEYDGIASLSKRPTTAVGQYDIYDIFLEKSLSILNEGDVFGFIVPDSIFREQHLPIRKKMLSETSLKYVIRIGEFIFSGVNTSVSVIIGKKGYNKGNTVICANLPNSYTKLIASGTEIFGINDSKYFHECSQDSFIDDNYNFSIDIDSSDSSVFEKLANLPTIKDYLTNTRGVELSKKGFVVQCSECRYWMPKPKSESLKCPHCGKIIDVKSTLCTQIICDSDYCNKSHNSFPFVAGEDMQRYSYNVEKNIILGYTGINYKSSGLYSKPKILVRKTGVGITAVLDYKGCYVNQVVYVLKKRESINDKAIPLEFFIALLNSRVVTYWILKKYGSSKWVTHPYLSQQMVNEIPVPNVGSFSSDDWKSLNLICAIVQNIYIQSDGIISESEDVEIEKLILELYRLNGADFKKIYDVIDNAEKLIPFRRLLTIPREKWDIDI